MRKKLTIDYICSEFKKEGYILLTEKYINNSQKLDYICPKGHKHSISWSNWNHPEKYRCPYCYGNKKLTIEFIRSEFKKEGCVLLSKKYINCMTKLKYVTSNGDYHSIKWNDWKDGHRFSIRYTIDDVRKEFEKKGYKLLTKKYTNCTQKFEYICNSGHIHSISFISWLMGQRCSYCYFEDLKISRMREGNPSWKGGISKEPYCQDWTNNLKEFVKARDGFKCLNPYCSGKDSTLAVHHIDYNKKSCGAENLITVCRSCNSRANTDRGWHKAWYKAILHKRYGYVYEG